MDQKNIITIKNFGVFGVIFFFLFIQFINQKVILSDTGIYLYIGQKILSGQILYKDLFFDNLPLFPYISAIYLLIFNGSILAFFYTSALECAGISYLIFKIVLKKYNNFYYAYSAVLLFLFSGYTLLISRFQIGITTATLFIILSYYLLLQKKGIWAGIFMAICVLTKIYFLPIAFAITIWAFLDLDKKVFYKYVVAGAITSIIIFAPFIYLAPNQVFDNIIKFNLITRSTGTGKWGALGLLLKSDLLLLLLSSILVFIKKEKLIILIYLTFLIFFIFYKDIYYVYFGILIPWLAIGCVGIVNIYNKPWELIFVMSIIITLPNLYNFFATTKDIGNLNNYQKMVDDVKAVNPSYIYGDLDIAPILAYSTNIPLLNNSVAVDQNLFRSGILDKHKLLEQVKLENALVVTYGVNYPNEKIYEEIISEIIDKNEFKNSCKLINSYDTDWYKINRINYSVCK